MEDYESTVHSFILMLQLFFVVKLVAKLIVCNTLVVRRISRKVLTTEFSTHGIGISSVV